MKLQSALASLGSPQRLRRSIAVFGGLFITAVLAFGSYDFYRGYRAAIDNTGRELETQARIIAEQTARSIQAVDVVLRYIAAQYQKGALAGASERERYAYLQEQAVGLVQINGLHLADASGRTLASWVYPTPASVADVSDRAFFEVPRDVPSAGLYVGGAIQSRIDGEWLFPMARRVERPDGTFNGIAAARGRVAYFAQFYRDVQLEPGTKITLMHQDGTLLSRYPQSEGTLGKHFPLFDEMLAQYESRHPGPSRTVSPIDGVERFGAIAPVPEYPLVALVTRDVDSALAPWRAQFMGAAGRGLALVALAALLLWAVVRQLSRLQAARESLAKSEERFALAAAGSNDGIIDWDIASGRFYSSKRAMEIVGIDSDVTERSRDEWVSLVRYRDRARAREDLLRFLASRDELRDVEYQIALAGGSLRWVRHRHICVRDASGRALRLTGSVSDVTAQKRAEAGLRESEERFALAVAGSNDGILDWDIVNDRIYASERAMRILGIDSDVTMRSYAEMSALCRYHRSDLQQMKEDLDAFLAGRAETSDGEYRVQLPNGEYRWVRHRNKCVRDADGRPIRMAGSVSDIDAHKRAEAALRESQARYQLAVDGSNQGLWDWDLVSDRLFLSPRAQELMGLAPSKPLRPRREWIALSPYHPEDKDAVRAAISAHLRGETGHFAAEYRLKHPSGDWRWIRQRGLALRDDRGRAYRMAGSMEDVTDYKNAEAERVRLEDQLLQAKKLEAIGTLAGGIAHDFNNILSAILGYGEMAQKDAREGTPLRRHIDAAMSAGHRAKSLVERILAFSRSGMGERAPVHVQSVVGEALDLVAASLPKGVTLERKLGAGDAAVMGDPTQIHQVVMNLCTNAIQAMKSGGTLTVSLDPVEKSGARLATSVLSGGKYLRLGVRDTGAGIPPSVLERIFDPFFTTKEVGVGTGLGLSLVHGIVTDLGGGIDVESRVGEGATFTVYLPWSSSVAAPASVDEAVPEGSGETILLVDDEEPLVRLGEEMIAGLGYEPVGFTSSAAALQSFRASPSRFHAVLSDEAMPEMTGSELAREIRAIRPDIPIVLMSGFVSPALLGRARDLGVMEVLAKPLVERDIARGLANALRNGGQP